MAICREHGQAPAWWDGLDGDDQDLLLADYAIRAEEHAAAVKRGRRGR